MIASHHRKFVLTWVWLLAQAIQSNAQVWHLDTSFGENGKLTLPPTDNSYSAWLKSPTGGYYMQHITGKTSFELFEFDHYGHYSDAILSGGRAQFSFPGYSIASSITQDMNGNFYVGRFGFNGIEFWKFDPIGDLSEEFNNDGVSEVYDIMDYEFSGGFSSPRLTSDGHFVSMAFSSSPSISNPSGSVIVLRWTPEGKRDYAYNGNGVFGLSWYMYRNLYSLDSQHRLLYYIYTEGRFERIGIDGELDPTFNPSDEMLALAPEIKRIWSADYGYIFEVEISQNNVGYVKCTDTGEKDYSFGNQGVLLPADIISGLYWIHQWFYHPLHGNIMTGIALGEDGLGFRLFALGMDANGNLSAAHIPNGIMYFPLAEEDKNKINFSCSIDPYGYPTLQERLPNSRVIHRFTYDGMPVISSTSPCRVYPNPCTTALSIDFPFEDARRPVSVEIIASSGQIVDSFNYNGFGSLVFTEPLDPGLYILRMNGESNSCVEKFIVE